MDFKLTREQMDIQKAVRQFAESKESRPRGPDFELPPEGAFRVFPSRKSLLE